MRRQSLRGAGLTLEEEPDYRGRLQVRLQLAGMQISVAPAARQQADNELIAEAMAHPVNWDAMPALFRVCLSVVPRYCRA